MSVRRITRRQKKTGKPREFWMVDVVFEHVDCCRASGTAENGAARRVSGVRPGCVRRERVQASGGGFLSRRDLLREVASA
jgi:hypothetical protein